MKGTTNIPSVYVLLFDEQDNIVFLMRENTGYKDGFACLPSGHVESEENNRRAAARELFEEVGIEVGEDALSHVFTMHRRNSPGDIRSDVFFAVKHTDWNGEPKNMEPEKHSELTWHAFNDLPYDRIVDYQAAVLRAIKKGQTYLETGWI